MTVFYNLPKNEFKKCSKQTDSFPRTLSFKKSQPAPKSPSTGWTVALIWVGSFLNNCFFMWSTGVEMHIDIDVMGYDVRGMIIGVIVPCFTTFISYLIIREEDTCLPSLVY